LHPGLHAILLRSRTADVAPPPPPPGGGGGGGVGSAAAFEIVESLEMTGMGSARLTARGIGSGVLRHGVLRGGEEDFEFGAAARARLESYADLALATSSRRLVLDEELLFGAVLAALAEDDQAEADRLLDSLRAVKAHLVAYAPSVRLGVYGLGETGTAAMWLDQVTHAAQLGALQARLQRIHQRYNAGEASLEPEGRDLFDFAVYDVGGRSLDVADQVAFQALALAYYRDHVARGKEVWWYGTTHAYGPDLAGRPLPGSYLRAQIVAASAVPGCAGAWLWYQDGFSASYFDDSAPDPLDRPAWVWAVQTSDPSAWAAAASSLRFTCTLGQQCSVQVAPAFAAAGGAMDDVVAAIVAGINAAVALAEPAVHPGTVGGVWDDGDERIRLWLDYRPGDNRAPPANKAVMTNILLSAPTGGTSIFAAHLGAGLDPVHGIPSAHADEWHGGWAWLDVAETAAQDWLAGVISAARALGAAASGGGAAARRRTVAAARGREGAGVSRSLAAERGRSA
jgi:hypothetical protein